MSRIYTKSGLCIFQTRIAKNKGGSQVREGEEWNYTKSGDISNVSQVHDDD